MCGRSRIGGVLRMDCTGLVDEYIPVLVLFWGMPDGDGGNNATINPGVDPRRRYPDDSDLTIGYSTTVSSEGLEDSDYGNLQLLTE